MNTDHVTAAISKLSAVPAALLFARRLGITHVYQAAECGGRWYGADDAALARLGAALESGQPDAYSRDNVPRQPDGRRDRLRSPMG